MSSQGHSILAALVCLWGMNAYGAGPVDNAVLANDQDGTDWPAYGRTFGEGHYSPLNQIRTDTVKRLGLAWTLDLDLTNSISAPLEVGGVVYLGAGHGIVYAVDAKSGRQLWRYDAEAAQLGPSETARGMGYSWHRLLEKSRLCRHE